MKWTHVFFDLDNTLYNHELAFKKTIQHCAALMLARKGVSVAAGQWFDVFKLYCDTYWKNYENGIWSRATYQIKRYESTNNEFNISSSDEEALAFQEEYQSKVASFAEPFSSMGDVLSILKKNKIKLGIITNGAKKTQMQKIRALDLMKWFEPDMIFISEEIGLSKPHTDVFHHVREEIGNYLYIGDSWDQDIQPALEAGFDVIYFNSRKEKGSHSLKEIPEVTSYRELLNVLNL
ncbi:HAD-IA family hydrolase [Pseudalkalibacillus hwajinpoensis]|uniref:HAD family hydrolase n=1 Tax=Guptibacillus hwajinpoensis TaxID=208199 RepID=UPI00325A69CF